MPEEKIVIGELLAFQKELLSQIPKEEDLLYTQFGKVSTEKLEELKKYVITSLNEKFPKSLESLNIDEFLKEYTTEENNLKLLTAKNHNTSGLGLARNTLDNFESTPSIALFLVAGVIIASVGMSIATANGGCGVTPHDVKVGLNLTIIGFSFWCGPTVILAIDKCIQSLLRQNDEPTSQNDEQTINISLMLINIMHFLDSDKPQDKNKELNQAVRWIVKKNFCGILSKLLYEKDNSIIQKAQKVILEDPCPMLESKKALKQYNVSDNNYSIDNLAMTILNNLKGSPEQEERAKGLLQKIRDLILYDGPEKEILNKAIKVINDGSYDGIKSINDLNAVELPKKTPGIPEQ
ncbi:MAG: hypothetical protein CMF42_04095 [Legionellales bacterium]|nr:hypothetical protein [Legionellales bacterium]OUX67525.1 MAG: hypothetical protein CBD38_02475 [bacterium TMED178]